MSETNVFKLRININGFDIDNIRVGLVATEPKESKNVTLKIVALRKDSILFSTSKSEETLKEFVKHYEILSKYNVDPCTMRHGLDPKNPLYLIVEFISSSNENVYINLDDSCESLVEMAAKCLLNIKNIEALKYSIENPFDSNPIKDEQLAELFSPSIVKDLNAASLTSFSPIRTIQARNGDRFVQISINVPAKIQTASLGKLNTFTSPHAIESIIGDSDRAEQANHLCLRFEGLNMICESNTADGNSTSIFRKQIKLPKGSLTQEAMFKLDNNQHVLKLLIPFFGL